MRRITRPLLSQTTLYLGEGLCPPCLILWGHVGTAGAVGHPNRAACPGCPPLALITPSPGAQMGFSRSTAVTRTQQTSQEQVCVFLGSPVGVQGGVSTTTSATKMLGVLRMQNVPFQNEIFIAFFKMMCILLYFFFLLKHCFSQAVYISDNLEGLSYSRRHRLS